MDVQELARDIEKNGLLSPVIVQEYNKEYIGKYYKWRLIAGFRRFTSHKVLGWKVIRATVSKVTDEKGARIINLRENLLRKDLNIVEEARAVEHLQAFGMTLQEIGIELGKSYGWVQVRAYLLQLPQEIQEQAAAGFVTQHQIRDIKNLPSKEMQFEAVRKIKEAKEKGEKTPIIRAKKSESSLAKRRRQIKEIAAMMDHIQEAIGNNFGTRCLAWCSGNITDNAVYQEIRAIAEKNGRPYVIPVESVASLAGMDINAERT
jgi:ParB family chromosome partitioning protein